MFWQIVTDHILFWHIVAHCRGQSIYYRHMCWHGPSLITPSPLLPDSWSALVMMMIIMYLMPDCIYVCLTLQFLNVKKVELDLWNRFNQDISIGLFLGAPCTTKLEGNGQEYVAGFDLAYIVGLLINEFYKYAYMQVCYDHHKHKSMQWWWWRWLNSTNCETLLKSFPSSLARNDWSSLVNSKTTFKFLHNKFLFVF